MTTEFFNITVIGAGNGGKTMAAHLGYLGYPVTLYNRTANRVQAVKELGHIELIGAGFSPGTLCPIARVTSDIAEALSEAKLIMVVIPSSAHAEIAKVMSPHLKDGQVAVLHPGRTCGAIEFRNVLDKTNCQANVIIAETETFIYASRSDGPAEARIFSIKQSVPLAALPATANQTVLDLIRQPYPQYINGGNVLKTGLNNMGAIFHPALALLNAGWIEATFGDFDFYVQGATQSVARVLEVLDRERVTVASALGIQARSGLDWLSMAYDAHGENLYEAIHAHTGYAGIKAPGTLQHRYIFEDVPMSLVPIASLGKMVGVSVRVMDAIIRLACVIHSTDYWRRGRTVEKLGIQHLSVAELLHFVNEYKLAP
ncbi:MAG TPA: NAD/NADP octopine/nopaline dehydrogenase family protein [Anaerolineaceae bacterium]|nr:NAD/NADP octopine/nopaline dehydrogenase family protein [Anaerolineaceae bacterium]